MLMWLNEGYRISCAEQLSQIQVGDTVFSIQYFLGGDWKFLACVTGVDAASCTYACILCKCS